MQKLPIVFHHYKKSIFFRFLALIFALVSSLLLLFSYFYYDIISDGYEKQSHAVNQSLLYQIADNIESSIEFIERKIISIGENKYAVNAAIQPGIAFSSRNANLLLFLSESVNSDKYLSEIHVYEKTSNTSYVSDGIITDIETVSFEEYFGLDKEKVPSTLLSSIDYRYETYICYVNNHIYVVHKSIPIEGTYSLFVVAKLDKTALFENAQKICQQTSSRLDITDKYGDQVISINPSGFTDSKVNTLSLKQSYWEYQFFPAMSSLPSAAYFITTILPFFLIILAISIILVPLISWRVYSPIRELVQDVSIDKQSNEMFQNMKTYSNEIDYLRKTYDSVIHNRDSIMKLIDEVRPELEERLLKSLISGTEYTEEELQEKLHSMCSTQIADYKYQVILAYPVTLQNEEDDVMHQIVLHQLKEYLNTLEMDSETTMFMISEVKSYSAVILRYPKSDDRGISASPASYILEVIKKFSSTQAIHIMISEGKIVDSLKDLRLSYENAEDKITYQIYLSDESGDSGLTSDYGNHKEFEEKLESLKDSLKRYELASADKFVQTILKEIAQSNSEVDEKKHQYTLILDLLAERALMLGSDNQSDKRKRLGSVYTKLKNDNARKTIDKSVLDAAHELLQLIKEASLRKQSRLVIGAKECVEKYYGSIDLSMNRIAEELGISASYLSTIFAEYTGMNLVGYLSTYRVKMAQDLLIHTNIKIRDVGYKTGFNTVQNFNRVFKRYVGITPGEYRSKYQTAKDFI